VPFLRRRKKDERDRKRGRAYRLLEEIDKEKAVPSVIIKEKEGVKEKIQMVNCSYCETLMPVTSHKCPHCGTPRKK
jgi:rubrerythrin